MKKLLLIMVLFCGACQSSTKYGACVGINEKDENPTLDYRLSVRNTILSVFFMQMIFPPIIMLINETYCPVGVKGI